MQGMEGLFNFVNNTPIPSLYHSKDPVSTYLLLVLCQEAAKGQGSHLTDTAVTGVVCPGVH